MCVCQYVPSVCECVPLLGVVGVLEGVAAKLALGGCRLGACRA